MISFIFQTSSSKYFQFLHLSTNVEIYDGSVWKLEFWNLKSQKGKISSRRAIDDNSVKTRKVGWHQKLGRHRRPLSASPITRASSNALHCLAATLPASSPQKYKLKAHVIFRIHWTRIGHSNRGYNHQSSSWQLGKLWCKSLKRASHNLEAACVTGTGNLLKVMRQNLTCLWVWHQVNIFV